jgi:hypothetical protein
VEKRGRVQVSSIIALIVALHLTVLWFLLATSRVMVRRSESQGLEIVFLARPPASVEQISSAQQKPSEHERHRMPPRREASESPLPTQRTARPEQESTAIQAPIDWAAELSQAVKAASADSAAQSPRDFGFPHLPRAKPKTPQFEWDYAATHRVEQIAGGGLLVNLSDRCVLVFFPLPLVGCGIGTKTANGDLLKHMSDPAEAGRGSAPH